MDDFLYRLPSALVVCAFLATFSCVVEAFLKLIVHIIDVVRFRRRR